MKVKFINKRILTDKLYTKEMHISTPSIPENFNSMIKNCKYKTRKIENEHERLKNCILRVVLNFGIRTFRSHRFDPGIFPETFRSSTISVLCHFGSFHLLLVIVK